MDEHRGDLEYILIPETPKQKCPKNSRGKNLIIVALKDVRANCFCASLLSTQISYATSYTSARAK